MKSLICAAAALVFGACTAFGFESHAFDRILAVSGPVDLDVKSDRGGIIVRSGSALAVRVHCVIKPLFGMFDLGLADANILALERNPPIEQVGNRIRIGYVREAALLEGVTIDFEIETPGTTSVNAYTNSGGIQIEGLSGPVNTNTSSGRTQIGRVTDEVKVTSRSGAVFVSNARGRVVVRNESGGIQIVGVRGPIEAQTTSGRTEISDVAQEVRSATHSGSIKIDNAKEAVIAYSHSGSIEAFLLAGSVHAETKSGAINISQRFPAPIRALAYSGAISVELAHQGAYTIDAQSDSGKVSGLFSNGSGTILEAHHLKKQIGGGGPLVDLDTHSSKIAIN